MKAFPGLLILPLILPSFVIAQSKAEMKQEIDDLNTKISALTADADKDGISDFYDLEPNTPEGSPVDPHGVALDSDHDGCLDLDDPEPYSSPVQPAENCQNLIVDMQLVKDYVDSRQKDYGGAPAGTSMTMIMVNMEIKPVQGQRYLIDQGFYNKYISPKSADVKAVKAILSKPAYKIFDITAFASEFPHYTGQYILLVITGDKLYSSPVTLLKEADGKTFTYDFTRQ